MATWSPQRNGQFVHGAYGARYHTVNPVAQAAVAAIRQNVVTLAEQLQAEAERMHIAISHEEALELARQIIAEKQQGEHKA